MTPDSTTSKLVTDTYEPPAVTVLGTLAEMTLGNISTGSDGINPGSLIGR